MTAPYDRQATPRTTSK